MIHDIKIILVEPRKECLFIKGLLFDSEVLCRHYSYLHVCWWALERSMYRGEGGRWAGRFNLPAKNKTGRIKGEDRQSLQVPYAETRLSSWTEWQRGETRLNTEEAFSLSGFFWRKYRRNTDTNRRTELTYSACSWKPGVLSFLYRAGWY